MSSKTVYKPSPFGAAKYPWITKADTEFNDGGLFHVKVVVAPEDGAQEYKAEIKHGADAAFEAAMEGKSPAERKKWSPYYPFEDVLDDAGNETGAVEFTFKQNQTIRLKDGTTKKVSIRVVDHQDKDTKAPVFGGSILRCMYAARPATIASARQVGVRLDFCAVQVKEFKQGNQGGGFGAVEGGSDAPSFGSDHAATSEAATSTDGDY